MILADGEREFISIERIKQYLNLESEFVVEHPIGLENKLNNEKPKAKTAIEFNNVVVRYKQEDAPALNSISFTIPQG
jgi:ABC-type multidrug transport system fused ATPase/permease subunit